MRLCCSKNNSQTCHREEGEEEGQEANGAQLHISKEKKKFKFSSEKMREIDGRQLVRAEISLSAPKNSSQFVDWMEEWGEWGKENGAKKKEWGR